MVFAGEFYSRLSGITQDENISEDKELDYEAGLETGRQETIDEVAEKLNEAGYGSDELDQLFFDPDPSPRRHKGRKKYRHHVRRYDPAPKKRKVTARRGKKGILNKMKKLAMPGAAAVTFYAGYVKRRDELLAAGLITEKSVFKAIEYDIKNFNSTDAMKRVQTQAGGIATGLIGGWVLKETGLFGKYSALAGDLMTGFGIGTATKALLDPPLPSTGSGCKGKAPCNSTGPSPAPEFAVQNQNTARTNNPYLNGGY